MRPPISDQQQQLLDRVHAAVTARNTAASDYTAAVHAAAAAGIPLTRIAGAAGTTYQAIQSILKTVTKDPNAGNKQKPS